jgi:hypothetical protein
MGGVAASSDGAPELTIATNTKAATNRIFTGLDSLQIIARELGPERAGPILPTTIRYTSLRILQSCRVHQTLRLTPKMEARMTDYSWNLGELVSLLQTGVKAA